MKREEPLSALLAAYERQLGLCDQLEAVADSLPERADRQRCRELAQAIGPTIRQTHATEMRLLIPLLSGGNDGDLAAELRRQQVEDESAAEEVREELLQLGQGKPVLAPEATGYMLRGLFESLRRHVRRERLLLNDLARRPDGRDQTGR